LTGQAELRTATLTDLNSEGPKLAMDELPPWIDVPIRVKGAVRYRLRLELASEHGPASLTLNAQLRTLGEVVSSLMVTMEKQVQLTERPARSSNKEENKKAGSARLPAQRLDFNQDRPLKSCLDDIERQILIKTLERHNNNKTHAAKALGLSRFGFLKKLDKHQLR
jgi:transcriptional regulator with GAF, ATPase, and Fis domain